MRHSRTKPCVPRRNGNLPQGHRLQREMYHSQKLYDLLFGSFNKRFSNQRTDFDWLSRDQKE